MKNSTSVIAFITAFALHLIIGGILLLSVDFTKPKMVVKNSGPIIKASVINKKLFDDLEKRKKEIELAKLKKIEDERIEQERIKEAKKKAEKIAKKKEEARIQAIKDEAIRKQKEIARIKAETKRKAELEIKRKAEAKLKAEAAIKKKAEAKRKKEEAIKKKQEAERVKAKKIAEEKAKKKIADAKRKKIEDAKIKAEKIEKERKRKEELDKQMEAEFMDDFADANNSKQLSEIARYKALIQSKISRYWKIDPNMKGKTCTLAIRLAPDGLVISADYVRGDMNLCDSAKRATLNAQTLPMPNDPDISVKFRDFYITLEPEL